MRRFAPLLGPCLLCLAAVLGSVPARAAGSRDLGWSPERTWVVVIGALDFRDRNAFEPFPKARRRDARLVELFRKRGVPNAQIAYLRDAGVTARGVVRTLGRVAAQAREGDLLFVYYTGHGWIDEETGQVYFATFDAVDGTKGVQARSIVSIIDRDFRGARVFLFADCCNSGALADAVRRTRSGVAYACLCSSQAAEESTGNWTFTDCLLDALTGSASRDLDGDGLVTIGELATSATEEMAIGEEQLVAFVTTRGFAPETPLAVAGPRRSGRVGELVDVSFDGESYRGRITDARGENLKIHVIGDDDYDDVWVRASAVRPARVRQYAVGTAVEVESEGDWYIARILEVRAGVHRVHYVGYSADEDEWVPASRIRTRRVRTR